MKTLSRGSAELVEELNMSKQEKLTPNAMMFQFARMLQEIKDASKAGREYAAEVEEGIKATAVAASLGPSEEMIEKVKHVIKNLDMLGTTLLKTRGDLLEPLADMTSESCNFLLL